MSLFMGKFVEEVNNFGHLVWRTASSAINSMACLAAPGATLVESIIKEAREASLSSDACRSPQSGLWQVAALEQGKSIRTVPMHKPSSTEVRTLVERDLTQQQSRLSDSPRVDDSEDPPPALPDSGCKQALEQADVSYAPTGTANIPTLVRYTHPHDGSARHGPTHIRPDDTKRLITITTLALAVVCTFTVLSLLLPSTRPQGDVSRWCDTSECRQM
ncbi:hypothetical protein MRX96_025810 [Rhipicephalus microplus]